MTYRTLFLFKALHDGLAQMLLPLCLRSASVSKERTYNGPETDLERRYARAREVFENLQTLFYAFHLIYSLRELLQVSTHILTADAVYLRLGLC